MIGQKCVRKYETCLVKRFSLAGGPVALLSSADQAYATRSTDKSVPGPGADRGGHSRLAVRPGRTRGCGAGAGLAEGEWWVVLYRLRFGLLLCNLVPAVCELVGCALVCDFFDFWRKLVSSHYTQDWCMIGIGSNGFQLGSWADSNQ